MSPACVVVSATGNDNDDDMVSNGEGERREGGGKGRGDSTSCQPEGVLNLDPDRSNFPQQGPDQGDEETTSLLEGLSDPYSTIDPSFMIHLIRQLLPVACPSDPCCLEVSSRQLQQCQGDEGEHMRGCNMSMTAFSSASASACEQQDARPMQGNAINRIMGIENPVNEEDGVMHGRKGGIGAGRANHSSSLFPLRDGEGGDVVPTTNFDGTRDNLEVRHRDKGERGSKDERGGRAGGGPNVNGIEWGVTQMGNCRIGGMGERVEEGLEVGRFSEQVNPPVDPEGSEKEPSMGQMMNAAKKGRSEAMVAREQESDSTGREGMKSMDIVEECWRMDAEEPGGCSKDCKDDGFLDGEGHREDLRGDEEGEEEEREEQDPREEAGCILWDLASNKTHAEFLVQNHLLEVVVAILQSSHTDRMREICLGVLANLACHSETERAMTNMEGLVDISVQQIFVNDPASLTEVCRLLSASLHGNTAAHWAFAISSDLILGRILWIASNTMQPQLLEKSCELLLAMVDGKSGVGAILIPALLQLSLSDVLIDLLGSELSAIIDGSDVHGDTVLDTLLQVAEVLSLHDDCAVQLAANQKLFSLASQVLQLPGRDEPGPSAITAVVLIANLLAEEPTLISVLASDPFFVERLLPILPVVADDPGARNALWSVLGRIFKTLVSQEWPLDHDLTTGITAVIVAGRHMLIEDLENDHTETGHQPAGESQYANGAADGSDDLVPGNSIGLEWKIATIADIVQVMERWLSGLGEIFVRDQTAGGPDSLLSVNKVMTVCRELQKSMAATDKVTSTLLHRQRSQGQAQITGHEVEGREARFEGTNNVMDGCDTTKKDRSFRRVNDRGMGSSRPLFAVNRVSCLNLLLMKRVVFATAKRPEPQQAHKGSEWLGAVESCWEKLDRALAVTGQHRRPCKVELT